MKQCIENADIIISGVPFTKDNVTINSPYSNQDILIDELYEHLKNNTFIAGGIPNKFYQNSNVNNIDLLKSEELTILNAIPTVEGTIKIAIEETEETIHESNILILGFGRIGKILCKRFSALGANIYCTARKNDDLTWIRESRYIPVEYNQIENYIDKIDLVINTVPAIILNEEIIRKVKENCVIIDIASNPGGVDKNLLKRYNIKEITALGIPGKIAPMTAAKYIKMVIEKELQKII